MKYGLSFLISGAMAVLIGGQFALAIVPPIIPPVIPPIVLPPILAVVTPVPTDTTDTNPAFTFSTTEAGNITYQGDCVSLTGTASAGNNTVGFFSLPLGLHNNCKIKVHGATSDFDSAWLDVPAFTVSLAVPLIPPVVAKCADFSDITMMDADCPAITYVKSIGAMTGNPDGTFDPSGLLQRDQVSKIALETFKKFTATTDYCGGVAPFGDVSETAWAFQYICRAKALGVVTGYLSGPDKGLFKPARSVNRSEFLAIILRNLTETMPTGSSYSDVSTDSWYAGYAKFSKNNNLFEGSTLSPTNFTTRREVAQVIYKLHSLGKI